MHSHNAGPGYYAALRKTAAAWLQELFPSRCLLCETRCEGDWCNACGPLLEREDRLRPARCDRCGLLQQTARPHPVDPKTADQHRARSPLTAPRARQPAGSDVDSAQPAQRPEMAGYLRQPQRAPSPHNCPWPNPPWDRIWVGMRYRPPLDGLLLAAKFGGEPHICRALGRWLAYRTDQQPRLVIPIPSTPARLRERGYNPVEQIARGWLEASSSRQRSCLGANHNGSAGCPSLSLEREWLRRSDRKSRQSALGAAARRRAARSGDVVAPEFGSQHGTLPASSQESDAGFYLHAANGGDGSALQRSLGGVRRERPGGVRRERPGDVPRERPGDVPQGGAERGRRHDAPATVVTLLDDVMTTGETLAAACRVLRRAGVSRIEVVTLMRRG